MASFDRADTHTKVIDVIAEKLKVEKTSINHSSTLQDLGADSLDMVEIIMKLEELFGIEIKDEDAEKIKTVNEAVALIHAARTK